MTDISSDGVFGKLSPRARVTLDDLTDDMRSQLVRTASVRSAGDEISVRDILEAFESLRDSPRGRLAERMQRLWLLLAVYAATAVASVTVAGFALATDAWSGRFLIGLLTASAALVGTSLALLLVSQSRASADLRHAERQRTADRGAWVLLERWTRIEGELRLLAARSLGSSAAEVPVGALIDELARTEVLSARDVERARMVLSSRNDAAHGTLPADSGLREILDSADGLLRRLQAD